MTQWTEQKMGRRDLKLKIPPGSGRRRALTATSSRKEVKSARGGKTKCTEE